MSNEREDFEAWAMHPLRHGNYQLKRDSEFGLYESKTEGAFEIWQASRKVALEGAADLFDEQYTLSTREVVSQIKEILK